MISLHRYYDQNLQENLLKATFKHPILASRAAVANTSEWVSKSLNSYYKNRKDERKKLGLHRIGINPLPLAGRIIGGTIKTLGFNKGQQLARAKFRAAREHYSASDAERSNLSLRDRQIQHQKSVLDQLKRK